MSIRSDSDNYSKPFREIRRLTAWDIASRADAKRESSRRFWAGFFTYLELLFWAVIAGGLAYGFGKMVVAAWTGRM